VPIGARRLRACERACVVYVERVDPDRGGDAHLVLASREGITAPGLTVVDLDDRVPSPGQLPGVSELTGGPQWPQVRPMRGTRPFGPNGMEETADSLRVGDC
jgi:hypothetical protein